MKNSSRTLADSTAHAFYESSCDFFNCTLKLKFIFFSAPSRASARNGESMKAWGEILTWWISRCPWKDSWERNKWKKWIFQPILGTMNCNEELRRPWKNNLTTFSLQHFSWTPPEIILIDSVDTTRYEQLEVQLNFHFLLEHFIRHSAKTCCSCFVLQIWI